MNQVEKTGQSSQQPFYQRQVFKNGIYITIALAAIAGGIALLAFGGHALAPIHAKVQYPFELQGKAWILAGSAQAHIIGLSCLAGGSGLASLGIYMVGKRLYHAAKEKSSKVWKFDEKLTDNRVWKMAKLTLIATAFVAGAILITASAYYLLHGNPTAYSWLESPIGNFVCPQIANLSIFGVVGGTVLATLALLKVKEEFLKNRHIVHQQTLDVTPL